MRKEIKSNNKIRKFDIDEIISSLQINTWDTKESVPFMNISIGTFKSYEISLNKLNNLGINMIDIDCNYNLDNLIDIFNKKNTPANSQRVH